MTSPDGVRVDKNNVLFLAEVINCNDGIATYCHTLAKGLGERGLKVFMISGKIRSDEKSEAKRARLQESFVEWLSFPEMRRFPPVHLILKIRKFIKERKITVINVHGLGMLYLGRMLSLATGARLVATYHPSVTGNLDNAIKSATTQFSWKQSLFLNVFFPDRLVLLSDENVRFIAGKSPLFKGRISKIFGGADLSHFVPPTDVERQTARTAFQFSDNDFVCIMVSRLSWVKGHDLLIKAVRKIRETNPGLSIKCIFVGSGGKDREAEILSFAHSGGAQDVDTFRFVGFMSDVRSALWSADIFILPSRFEGFPLGVAEAMSTGLVPIRTPSGGATDQIINGKTGFIVPFDDVTALHDAILRLTDQPLRHEMSLQCRDRAHRFFGVEPMVDAMLGVYGMDGKQS